MIIGCGDVALRMVPLLRGRYVLYALTRKRERFAALHKKSTTAKSRRLTNVRIKCELCVTLRYAPGIAAARVPSEGL